MHQSVVLNPYNPFLPLVIVTKVHFPGFSSANVFVAGNFDILADHNFMSGAGGELTFHFKNKTFNGLSSWDMNLNGLYPHKH